MADVILEVSTADRVIEVDTAENAPLQVNIGDEQINSVVDYSIADTVLVNGGMKVTPLIESVVTEFTMPEDRLDTLTNDMNTIRKHLLEAMDGMDMAIIDQISYAVDAADGIVRQKLEEISARFIGKTELQTYALKTEVTTMAIAKERALDPWTGDPIQDRKDWQESDNDAYLVARGLEADMATADNTDKDDDGNYIHHPLEGLAGTLAWEDSEGNVVYEDEQPDGYGVHWKVYSEVSAQDLYDLSTRVGNKQARFTEDIRAVATETAAYASKTETLEASAADQAISLQTMGGVMIGDVVYYLYDYVDEKAKDDGAVLPVIGQVVVFDPDMNVRMSEDDFEVDDTRFEFTSTVDGSKKPKDGWEGWQESMKAAMSAAFHTVDTQITLLERQVDKSLETWFGDAKPLNEASDADHELDSTGVTVAADETAYQPSDMIMYKNVSGAEITDVKDGDVVEGDDWEGQFIFPESDWRTTDTDDDTEKIKHLGDLFYDSVDAYRYAQIGSSTVFYWSKVADTALTEALSQAATAQATADGNMTYFSGSLPYTEVEDNTINDNRMGDVWTPEVDTWTEDAEGEWVSDGDGGYELADAETADDETRYWLHNGTKTQVFYKIADDKYRWRREREASILDAVLVGDVELNSARIGGSLFSDYISDPANTGTDNMVSVFSGGSQDDMDAVTDMVEKDLFILAGEAADGTAVSTMYRYTAYQDEDDETQYEWRTVEGASNYDKLVDLDDNKKNIYSGEDAPTGMSDGDMWISANSVKIWVEATDPDEEGYWKADNVVTALYEQADSKINLFHQATPPPEDTHPVGDNPDDDTVAKAELNIDDVWYCIEDNDEWLADRTYKYSTETVDDVTKIWWDQVAGDVFSEMAGDIDAKTTLWAGLLGDVGAAVNGDYWMPSVDEPDYDANKVYTKDGGSWVPAATYADHTLLDDVINGEQEIDGKGIRLGNKTLVTAIGDEVGSKIVLYTGDDVPGSLDSMGLADSGVVTNDVYMLARSQALAVGGRVATTTAYTYSYSEGHGYSSFESLDTMNIRADDDYYWRKQEGGGLDSLAAAVDEKKAVYTAGYPGEQTVAELNDILVITIPNAVDDTDGWVGDKTYGEQTLEMSKAGEYGYRVATNGTYTIARLAGTTIEGNNHPYAVVGWEVYDTTVNGVATHVNASNSETRYNMYIHGAMWFCTQGSTDTAVATWGTADAANAAVEASHWTGGNSNFVTGPNGEITGWSYTAGSDVASEMVFNAHNFKFITGSGGASGEVFTVDGNDVNFNGKVTFDNVVGGATHTSSGSAPVSTADDGTFAKGSFHYYTKDDAWIQNGVTMQAGSYIYDGKDWINTGIAYNDLSEALNQTSITGGRILTDMVQLGSVESGTGTQVDSSGLIVKYDGVTRVMIGDLTALRGL